jgi:hypothetical protein
VSEEEKQLKVSDSNGLDRYTFKKGEGFICVTQKEYSLVEG